MVVCGSLSRADRDLYRCGHCAAAGLLDAYFIPRAECVLSDASLPTAERKAMILARHLRSKRLDRFNARLVRREIGGVVREAAAMKDACDVLAEAGLIRPQSTRLGETKGRASLEYEVNPAVLGVPR